MAVRTSKPAAALRSAHEHKIVLADVIGGAQQPTYRTPMDLGSRRRRRAAPGAAGRVQCVRGVHI